MKPSTRNMIKGTIKDLKEGPSSTLAVIEIAPGVEIVAIIKASNIMIGVDE